MARLKELHVKWNHHLCVELSTDYLLVDRANLYQTGSHLIEKSEEIVGDNCDSLVAIFILHFFSQFYFLLKLFILFFIFSI